MINVGVCKNVHALAGTNGALYAVQEGPNAIVRILPDNQPVSMATAWGSVVENDDPVAEPLFNFKHEDSPSGFVVSSKETRKLYITCPDMVQSIMSVKDYNFGKSWNVDYYSAADDFDYPDEKPAGTFRILIVGDSRAKSAMPSTPSDKRSNLSTDDVIKWDNESTKRMNSFPKQLEFLLNAYASLNGARNHFEVLTLSLAGAKSVYRINGPALELVRKKDVDLVIALTTESNYTDFFCNPLTADGIPGGFDPEYALKPLESRIYPGVPRHLFELCKKRNFVRIEKNQIWWSIDWTQWDSFGPEIQKDLMDLTARPFRVFQDKLQSMKTSKGVTKELLMLYIPWEYWKNDVFNRFWRETCSEQHLNLLDLSESYYAMKTSFYPTNQIQLSRHYLLHGNTLIALLLSHFLTDQKWVQLDIEK